MFSDLPPSCCRPSIHSVRCWPAYRRPRTDWHPKLNHGRNLPSTLPKVVEAGLRKNERQDHQPRRYIAATCKHDAQWNAANGVSLCPVLARQCSTIPAGRRSDQFPENSGPPRLVLERCLRNPEQNPEQGVPVHSLAAHRLAAALHQKLPFGYSSTAPHGANAYRPYFQNLRKTFETQGICMQGTSGFCVPAMAFFFLGCFDSLF